MDGLTGIITVLSNIFLKTDIVGFIIICFMSIFMYVIYISLNKQINLLNKIHFTLYERNANFLTLQSSDDIVRAQYNMTKYTIIDSIMKIIHENNIHDKTRQKLILDNLLITCTNLYDRDISILSKLYYKNKKLSSYLKNNNNYKDIALEIFEDLKNNYSTKDIIVMLNNRFDNIINNTVSLLE